MNASPKLIALAERARTEAEARADALMTGDIYLIVCVPRSIEAFMPESLAAQLTSRADLIERLDQASAPSWSMRVIKIGRYGDRADISRELALEWAAKLKRAGSEWDEAIRIPFISAHITEDHWRLM